MDLVAFEKWLHTVDLYEFIAVLVILVGVIGFVRKVWPWLKLFASAVMRTAEILDAVGTLPVTVDRIEKKLEEVYHETHLNNGSSIKDATVRIERLLAEQSLQITSVLAWQQTHIHETAVAHAAFAESHERLEDSGHRLEARRQSFRIVPLEIETERGGSGDRSSRGESVDDQRPDSLAP